MHKERDGGLDLLRFSAIAAVLLLHSTMATPNLPLPLKSLFSFGWIGVDLFFVLSGFLIGHQTLWGKSETTKASTLKVFWIKRWLRTLPLYFFVLFVYAYLKPFATETDFKPALLPFFFFLQNYFPLTDFVQSWSICIEEQFYIILPLLTFILIPKIVRSPKLWLFFILAGFLARYFTTQLLSPLASEVEVDYYLRFPLYTHFDGLAVGVFLAASFPTWSRWPQRNKFLCSIIGITGVIATCFYFGSQINTMNSSYYFTLLSISFGLLVIGLRAIQIPHKLLFLIQWCAILSYGSYLWNNLYIRLLDKYFANTHWFITFIIFIILTHATALTSYFLIEKPFMKLRTKLLLKYKSTV